MTILYVPVRPSRRNEDEFEDKKMELRFCLKKKRELFLLPVLGGIIKGFIENSKAYSAELKQVNKKLNEVYSKLSEEEGKLLCIIFSFIILTM